MSSSVQLSELPSSPSSVPAIKVDTSTSINSAPAPPPPTSPTSPDSPSLMNEESWAKMFWSNATSSEKICAFCYEWSFALCLGNQLIIILLFLLIDPSTLASGSALNLPMTFMLLLLQFIQLLVMIMCHVGMLRELMALYVRPMKIWNMYMSVVLVFGAIYFTFFCFDRTSFNVDGYAPNQAPDANPTNVPDTDVQTYNDIPTIYIFFCYFSGAIITSTGFGDIAPAQWYTQMCTNAEMLMGVMYHVGVFGLTLAHFRTFQKLSEEEKAKQEAQKSMVSNIMDMVHSWQLAQKLKNIHPWLDTIRRWCLRHLAVTVIAAQAVITSLLFAVPGGSPFDSLTPADGSRYQIKLAIIIIMVLLETCVFVTVMFVSLRLVRSVDNKDLTANFLIQSYIATALLFGGIYFILFAATPHHQFSRSLDFNIGIFEVFYIFIHFSLTVLTTTGFGDIYARGIIARIFVLIEMLVSILYNAVIIGLGTSQLIDMQSAKAEAEFSKLKEREREEHSHRRRDSQTSHTSSTRMDTNHLPDHDGEPEEEEELGEEEEEELELAIDPAHILDSEDEEEEEEDEAGIMGDDEQSHSVSVSITDPASQSASEQARLSPSDTSALYEEDDDADDPGDESGDDEEEVDIHEPALGHIAPSHIASSQG